MNTFYHSSEDSDWAIAAVVVFDRTLSSHEINLMEIWLSKLYGLHVAEALEISYVGCYRDCVESKQALPEVLYSSSPKTPMTAQACARLAHEGGYTVFGTQFSTGKSEYLR